MYHQAVIQQKNNNFLFVKETVCNRLPRECTAHEIESIPYKFPQQYVPKYLCRNTYYRKPNFLALKPSVHF